MGENIITKDQYFKLKGLLKSNDDESINLAVKIVDASNMVESYPYVLALLTARENQFRAYNSELGRCQTVRKYTDKIDASMKRIGKLNLTQTLNLLDLHYSSINKEVDASIKKFIIMEYESTKKNEPADYYNFTLKLKPKAGLKKEYRKKSKNGN